MLRPKAYRYTVNMKTLSFLLIILFAGQAFPQYESYDEIVDKLSKYNNDNLEAQATGMSA